MTDANLPEPTDGSTSDDISLEKPEPQVFPYEFSREDIKALTGWQNATVKPFGQRSSDYAGYGYPDHQTMMQYLAPEMFDHTTTTPERRLNYRNDLTTEFPHLRVGFGKLMQLIGRTPQDYLSEIAAATALVDLYRTKPASLATLRGVIGNIGAGGELNVKILDDASGYSAEHLSLADKPEKIVCITDGMAGSSEKTSGTHYPRTTDTSLLQRLLDGLRDLPEEIDPAHVRHGLEPLRNERKEGVNDAEEEDELEDGGTEVEEPEEA